MHIIHRFSIPYKIISDNGLSFDNSDFDEHCQHYGIVHSYALVAYPQANGQVEAINKVVKQTIKPHLESGKGRWVDELSEALWAIRTTIRTSTGETPYALTYRAKVVLLSEVITPLYRRDNYDDETNQIALASSKDLLEERRLTAKQRIFNQKQTVARYFNKKVKA